MNGRAIRLGVLLALAGGWALAQGPDGPPPMAPSPAAAPAGADPAVPTGGPAPAVAGAVRDPFWPVGYAPRPVVKPVAGTPAAGAGAVLAPAVAARPPDWDEARRRLEVKGVSRIGRDKSTGREMYFADVNGRVVEDGDVVTVTWDGRVYRWRITHVSPTGLQLVKLDCRVE